MRDTRRANARGDREIAQSGQSVQKRSGSGRSNASCHTEMSRADKRVLPVSTVADGPVVKAAREDVVVLSPTCSSRTTIARCPRKEGFNTPPRISDTLEDRRCSYFVPIGSGSTVSRCDQGHVHDANLRSCNILHAHTPAPLHSL